MNASAESERLRNTLSIMNGALPHGQAELPIATLLAGEFFGEMAVLSANPRTATVMAVTHCTLYELTRPDLEAIAVVAPTVESILEATFQERTSALAKRRG